MVVDADMERIRSQPKRRRGGAGIGSEEDADPTVRILGRKSRSFHERDVETAAFCSRKRSWRPSTVAGRRRRPKTKGT